MDAFNGVGNGDFSQSLVRHKALTAQNSEAVSWREPVTDDAGIDTFWPAPSWVKKSSRGRKLQFTNRQLQISNLPLNFRKIGVYSPKFCIFGQTFSNEQNCSIIF